MNIVKEEYYKLYDKYEKPASTLFHKYVSKKLARFLTFYFLKWGVTPNQMTLASFILILVSVVIINVWDNIAVLLIFIFLTQLSYILDCSDGVVARIKKLSSSFGAFFDVSLDRFAGSVFFIGIGVYTFKDLQIIDKRVLFFAIASILYLNYTIVTTLNSFYFEHMKGYMKKKKDKGVIVLGVRVVYEFIDTGIMQFIFGVSLFFSFQYYIAIFYGIIGFTLSLGLYLLLYRNSHSKS